MSFLPFGRPQPSSAEKIAAAETEMEMVAEMMTRSIFLFFRNLSSSLLDQTANGRVFHRLNQSCTKKCIPSDYREGDLNKGESVCLDRCVSKFFDVQMKVSDKMQGDAALRQG